MQRHGAIYADEYGWNDEFERLVARIVADFVGSRDAGERAWIAEVDGARAGCVLCCRRDDDDRANSGSCSSSRGRAGSASDIGSSTSASGSPGRRGTATSSCGPTTCSRAARRIYEAAGFELVDEEPHHSFGHELVGQHWRLVLRS